jgi:PAB1-binding protein PBP1
MTAKKCRCPSDSPFLWKHDRTPTVFAKDAHFRGHGATMSQSQTQVVERSRAQGISLGTIHNLSNKAQNTISVRQFTIFSKAGKVL